MLRVDIGIGGNTNIAHTGTTGIGGDGLGDDGMLNGIEHGILFVGTNMAGSQQPTANS